jgi:hypothetical protein
MIPTAVVAQTLAVRAKSACVACVLLNVRRGKRRVQTAPVLFGVRICKATAPTVDVVAWHVPVGKTVRWVVVQPRVLPGKWFAPVEAVQILPTTVPIVVAAATSVGWDKRA